MAHLATLDTAMARVQEKRNRLYQQYQKVWCLNDFFLKAFVFCKITKFGIRRKKDWIKNRKLATATCQQKLCVNRHYTTMTIL